MQSFLKGHEFLASWASAFAGCVCAVLAVLGMFISSRKEGRPLNWTLATLRIAFLLFVAAFISPSVSDAARISLSLPMTCLMFALITMARD
jgi:hypothetical protein